MHFSQITCTVFCQKVDFDSSMQLKETSRIRTGGRINHGTILNTPSYLAREPGIRFHVRLCSYFVLSINRSRFREDDHAEDAADRKIWTEEGDYAPTTEDGYSKVQDEDEGCLLFGSPNGIINASAIIGRRIIDYKRAGLPSSTREEGWEGRPGPTRICVL
jgi:hypothetical protein